MTYLLKLQNNLKQQNFGSQERQVYGLSDAPRTWYFHKCDFPSPAECQPVNTIKLYYTVLYYCTIVLYSTVVKYLTSTGEVHRLSRTKLTLQFTRSLESARKEKQHSDTQVYGWNRCINNISLNIIQKGRNMLDKLTDN